MNNASVPLTLPTISRIYHSYDVPCYVVVENLYPDWMGAKVLPSRLHEEDTPGGTLIDNEGLYPHLFEGHDGTPIS